MRSLRPLEFSIDQDWYRPRIGVVFASGDDDPDDDRAQGFDAIMDNPNIAGGAFSFWVRQGLRLPVAGSRPRLAAHSVLPDLRGREWTGANFVNPGVLVLNGGVDAQLTTKLKLVTNINLLRFRHTETLQRLLSPERDRQCDRRGCGRRVSVPAGPERQPGDHRRRCRRWCRARDSSRSSPTRCCMRRSLS